MSESHCTVYTAPFVSVWRGVLEHTASDADCELVATVEDAVLLIIELACDEDVVVVVVIVV